MDVESLLQSVANEIKSESAPYVLDMVDAETQTQTWNELTLQMVSDVVSHQVIHMKKMDTSPTASSGPAKSCMHVSGMAWKDIAQILVNSHKCLCQNTNLKVAENIVKITVDQPFSAVDYMKTSVEVYISGQAEQEKAKETSEDLPQLMIEGNRDIEMSEIVDVGASLLKNELTSLQVDHSNEPRTELSPSHEHNGLLEQRKGVSLNDTCIERRMQPPLPTSQVHVPMPSDIESIMSHQDSQIERTRPPSTIQSSTNSNSMLKPNSMLSDIGSITSHQNLQTEMTQPSTIQSSTNSNAMEKLTSRSPEIVVQEFEKFEQNSNMRQNDNLENFNESGKTDEVIGSVSKQKEVTKHDDGWKVSEDNKETINENTLEHKKVLIEMGTQVKHKCQICRKNCRTSKQLERHLENHNPTKNEKSIGFKCDVCHKVFQSRWKLNKHTPRHDPDHDIHPCPQCDKVCKTVQSLLRHQRIHVEAPPHSCKECGATFRVVAKLKQHMTKEHNAVCIRHVCNICGSIYKNEVTLKDHMFEHSGKDFPCSLCPKTFRRPELLRCHMFRHKVKNKPKSFKCTICPSSYAEDRQLQVHIRLTHMKERDNVCKVCDKKFFYHYQLVAHEKTHSGIKEFRCKYCEKQFIKHASLVTHEMIHTGNKPWKCAQCAKGFATKAHKERHEKTHTGESKPEQKKFQCNSCPSKFRYKGQLNEHVKRHAGVKDHACHFCRKDFVSRSDLVRHLRMHTGGKPHKCRLCDETFCKRMELSEHELTHGNTTLERQMLESVA